MSAMTGPDLPAAMRASDADRDAVVSDLGENFLAGRLTAAELDERTGRALTARTWGELRDLLADLPAARPEPRLPASLGSRLLPPPLVTALAGLAIAALVLAVLHNGWGMAWLLVPALYIARRRVCSLAAPGHGGRGD